MEYTYVIFYRISDGNIYSYVYYNFEYDGETLLNKPTKARCATNNNVTEVSIGIKKWTKEDPQDSDFKDNIENIPSGEDLEEL